ncbi:MAG TPA: hypothetical protein VGM60_20645 [Pseudonocardia sp.]|jgi:hypothetical protein|uniref:hypothetical protein n=1 Tax=Pseudonocardia sp. TaxID=60912 RepID=UPI002F42143D
MPFHVRRTLTVTVTAAAVLVTGAGLAYADSDDNGSQSPGQHTGTGNGLSGGPTKAQVLRGAAVPLQDPTLGESTLLPPVYNATNPAGG